MFRSILAAALVLSASAVQALSIEPLPVPADGEQFWGLGTTGIYCVKAPCPWRGVFRIHPDGTRDRPLSGHDLTAPPPLRAGDADRARIETPLPAAAAWWPRGISTARRWWSCALPGNAATGSRAARGMTRALLLGVGFRPVRPLWFEQRQRLDLARLAQGAVGLRAGAEPISAIAALAQAENYASGWTAAANAPAFRRAIARNISPASCGRSRCPAAATLRPASGRPRACRRARPASGSGGELALVFFHDPCALGPGAGFGLGDILPDLGLDAGDFPVLPGLAFCC